VSIVGIAAGKKERKGKKLSKAYMKT